MTLSEIDISGSIARAKEMARSDKELSGSVRSLIELLVLIVELLLQGVNTNSRNSSTPPSQDPYRSRVSKKRTQGVLRRKPGGQPGHEGITIERVKNPEDVKQLMIDRRTLPKGKKFKRVDDEIRQVIEITISRKVTEYRAEVLEDEEGNQYVAEFPEGVTRPAQYGPALKGEIVYMNTFQLLPYARMQNYFHDQAQIPLSQGTIFNTGVQAFDLLAPFDDVVKEQLQKASVGHFDETGINIDGKLHWLHSASNDRWTLSMPHKKRGKEAMDEMGILPMFKGTACHDHWKAYFQFNCIHSLCNAHHLRELEWVTEHGGHQWASTMQKFLVDTNEEVTKAGGVLPEAEQAKCCEQFQKILLQADEECPPEEIKPFAKRQKKSKERNLIERLRAFESETLRFMTDPLVPFTNNRGERDIRMTKVQQKISGCFRSFKGAQIFCRVRSYISTCQKHGISPTYALSMLFSGRLQEILAKLLDPS